MRPALYLKWGIFLKILPFTLLFCAVKWGIHFQGLEIWRFDLLTGSLFGAATFVIAFILSGTLADYRTSEELVCQFASAIESIQDTALFAAANHPVYDPQPLTQGLSRILERLLGWLNHGDAPLNITLAIDDLNPLFARLEPHISGPIISRIQGEQGRLRFLVARMKLIRETEFLAPAYVLLQIFLAGAILALLLTSGDLLSKTVVVSGFLFTSFVYLVMLIHDLDNPFQYDGKSYVDIDLAIFDELLARLQGSLR